MITRDFILRQIQQLAQVLAVVLLRKRTDDEAGAQAALAGGLEAAGVPLETVRRMARADLLALCAREGVFSAEWAGALADLLAEDVEPGSWERAAWLYEAARAAGGPVPFDVDARIAGLRAAASG